MSSPYDIWMQRTLKEADDHVATEEEWQALLDYLNGNITAEKAASEYTKHVAKSEDRETVYIWSLLQDVAKDFTQAHAKLIELLEAITDLPPLDHKGGDLKSGEGEFWKDLPEFEFVLRENVDGLEFAAIRGADPVKTSQFINMCAFNARAYHDGLFPLEKWALMLCGEAFEIDYFEDNHKQALYLQAAAQYLILNGPEMYRLSAMDEHAGLYAGSLLKERRAVSAISRWNFWQERLSTLIDHKALPEDAQATAMQLAKKMADTMAGSDP